MVSQKKKLSLMKDSEWMNEILKMVKDLDLIPESQ